MLSSTQKLRNKDCVCDNSKHGRLIEILSEDEIQNFLTDEKETVSLAVFMRHPLIHTSF
jgi:redox-regulated HSP33 family molecular chaperone